MSFKQHINLLNAFKNNNDNEPENAGWRKSLYGLVFKADTKQGKLFDIVIEVLILANIFIILIESVKEIRTSHQILFNLLDYFFLIIFTIEVLLRIICSKKPSKYIFSFYGIIDIMSILPSYIGLFAPKTHVLMLIRSFRLLRIFRALNLVQFINESNKLLFAMLRSLRKILIFLFFVLILAVFLGSTMYLIEHKVNTGFNNIPQSIYWAIVTITTVGYGDVAPMTPMGKVIASFIMILGYAIIAVPTGIVSTSMMRTQMEEQQNNIKPFECPNCKATHHSADALFCQQCGSKL